MNSAELRERTLCVQCGPGVAVDEDGCCGMCGAQAFGPWANKAVAALERLEALEAALRDPHAQSDVNWVPDGWRALDAYTNGSAVVFCGAPAYDDETHNCDAMGCGSVGPHVLHYVALATPAPAGQKGGEE